jgi:hypothetical protein
MDTIAKNAILCSIMNRCMAMLLIVLPLAGCTSQGSSPMHDPFGRTTLPPPPTGDARNDPYYSSPIMTGSTVTNTPGINYPPPTSSGAANNAKIPTPSNNVGGSHGVGLMGAKTANASASGYQPSGTSGWTSPGISDASRPRPTVTETATTSNTVGQPSVPRSSDSNSGRLREITEMPKNWD